MRFKGGEGIGKKVNQIESPLVNLITITQSISHSKIDKLMQKPLAWRQPGDKVFSVKRFNQLANDLHFTNFP